MDTATQKESRRGDIESTHNATRAARESQYIADKADADAEAAAKVAANDPAERLKKLSQLKDAGLVSDEAIGTRRLYRVEPEGLADLREFLDGFWDVALANFKHQAEEETR